MLVKMPKTDQMVMQVQSEFQAKTMSETKGSKEQRVPQDKMDHLDLLVNTTGILLNRQHILITFLSQY